jgi:protein-tyrosine phosphatase
MTDARERLIPFESCLNFRDLGGYEGIDGRHLRWARLYRSMTPQLMTEADLDRALNQLRIRRVIDLRDRDDLDSGPLGRAPSTRHVVKFMEVGRFPELVELPVVEILPRHLERSAQAFAESMTLLAEDPGGATVFHCQTGKDRTGVLALMVLRLLGVSEDDAVDDYMYGAPLAAAVQGLVNTIATPRLFPPPASAREPPDAAAARAFLSRLDGQYGGARAYLEGLGVSSTALDRFVASMLE